MMTTMDPISEPNAESTKAVHTLIILDFSFKCQWIIFLELKP
jgi:hypothetical protein